MTRKNPRHHPGKSQPDAAKTSKVAFNRSRRAGFLVAIVLLEIVCAEGLFAIALRLTEGQWPYTRPKSANYLLFEPTRHGS